MIARVIDLARWRNDHPPLVRNLQAAVTCWQAWARLWLWWL